MQLADTTNKSEDLTAVIVDIAKRFRLKTVAEGIETADVALAAHEMDCDIGQGYYWSKPVPFDELLTLLNESREDGDDTFGHKSSDKDQARLMATS